MDFESVKFFPTFYSDSSYIFTRKKTTVLLSNNNMVSIYWYYTSTEIIEKARTV